MKSQGKVTKTDFSLTFHDWKLFFSTLPDFLFYRVIPDGATTTYASRKVTNTKQPSKQSTNYGNPWWCSLVSVTLHLHSRQWWIGFSGCWLRNGNCVAWNWASTWTMLQWPPAPTWKTILKLWQVYLSWQCGTTSFSSQKNAFSMCPIWIIWG